jgi:HK97 gp10 family phage protein
VRITVTPPPALDLSRLAEAQVRAALPGLVAGLKLMENAAKQRVARGPKTGRVYKRRGIEHQASAPGEPPATDTGALIASIVSGAEIEGAGLVGFLEARAGYAIHLEFGTRKMAARPFLTPSVEEHRARTTDLMRAAMNNTRR